MNRSLSIFTISLMALFLGGTQVKASDDRIKISIQEFEFDSKEYSLVIIGNDPERLDMPKKRPGADLAKGFLRHYYARFLLEQIQDWVEKNYRERGKSEANGAADNYILKEALQNYPDPYGFENRPSVDLDGRPMRSPVKKVDDYFKRESYTIAITERNNLANIFATVKLVRTGAARLFKDLIKKTHLIPYETMLATDEISNRRGEAHYELENLSNARGKYDFQELLLQSLLNSGLFPTKERPIRHTDLVLHIEGLPEMRPYYEAMGFRPYLEFDGIVKLAMDGNLFEENIRSFLNGTVKDTSRFTDKTKKMQKIIFLQRSRKVSVLPTEFMDIDYEKSLSFENTLSQSESKFTKTPSFINTNKSKNRCASSLEHTQIPFY